MTTGPAGSAAEDDVDDLGPHWRGGWTGSRPEQFTRFVQDAEPALWRLAWLLTGDRHRAEDLVQQTLVRTYVAWPRARDGDPMAYARRVLVNARTDFLRKHSRELLVDQHDHDAHAPRAGRPVPTQEVADRDVLVRALRQLSPRRRRVVVLRYLLDLSEREVADDLGVSLGTVKSTAARGLAQLRVLLEAPPGDDHLTPTATDRTEAPR
ncbi:MULTISPECIES: SigE family RNA polymerase sigma factor [Actinomycetes]|uniref:RNA polymerase sigma-70 factor (Sigma-E family) n=1 Tax=Pseudokineococcus lusitanus TaxID=763993 RepID=A0A3N1G9L0_9ACTN|nr:SigE family RNA polymerase sigma factor [Pseudokineococcus lusitanus]ROP26923.1 RNA polymerase sigma-70 factor (sigma-E family) [Pseudokineococcus lusitanus]